MKKPKLLRPIILLVISMLLVNISFGVRASTTIGTTSDASNIAYMTPISQPKAAGLAKSLAAGLAAGAVVGVVVGFYARLGYEYLTSQFGDQQKAASFANLNYDSHNLEIFDNPKN